MRSSIYLNKKSINRTNITIQKHTMKGLINACKINKCIFFISPLIAHRNTDTKILFFSVSKLHLCTYNTLQIADRIVPYLLPIFQIIRFYKIGYGKSYIIGQFILDNLYFKIIRFILQPFKAYTFVLFYRHQFGTVYFIVPYKLINTLFVIDVIGKPLCQCIGLVNKWE